MNHLNWIDQNFKPKYISPFTWIKTFITIFRWHALRTHALEQIDWNVTRKERIATLHGQPIPWWTYASIQFIDQVVPHNAKVLEIGGGNSTIYWLNRGNSVLTLETSPEWIVQILRSTNPVGNQSELVHIVEHSVELITEVLGDRTFDVIVNDGPDNRIDIADLLLSRIRPNGMLIWDNSERPEYHSKIAEIKNKGWHEISFFGLGPINAYAFATSIFFSTDLIISKTLKTVAVGSKKSLFLKK